MGKCEVCGSLVRVVGRTTKHYEPVPYIKIGGITISEFRVDGAARGYWVINDAGVGFLECSGTLEKLIADFFRENM